MRSKEKNWKQDNGKWGLKGDVRMSSSGGIADEDGDL
jgi:hypothetical protein